MAIHSMTGYARGQGEHGRWSWTWEVKSVNGRGLDVRCRVPQGMDSLEPKVRAAITGRLKRGNVNANLTLESAEGAKAVRLNEDALARLPEFLDTARERVPDAGPPTLDGLLNLRWLVDTEGDDIAAEDRDALETDLAAGLDQALAALIEVRRAEGQALAEVLTDKLDAMAALRDDAEKLAELQPAALRERLARQMDELLESRPDLPEERLAQEAALLMTKADIREELDRLGAHVDSARELIASGGVVGRRLDFLCQEFNREANTLCSKSQSIELTRVGLEIKTLIDQVREQVQNIE